MNDLQASLREEANKFADSVYSLMLSKLSEVLGGRPAPAGAVRAAKTQTTASKPKKRERVSQEKLEGVLARIVETLREHPEGLRSEQIRAKLSIDKPLFQRAAHLGRISDQLVQTGERRTTVYALPKPVREVTKAQAEPSKAQKEGRVIRKKKRAAA